MIDNPMIILHHPRGTSQDIGVMKGGSNVLLTCLIW